MRARLIETLANLIDTETVDGDVSDLRELQVRRFSQAYRDLAFGWKAVTTLARRGDRLPTILEPSDRWLWRAWLYHTHPKFDDPIVRRACELRRPERTTERNVIEALLIAKDFDLTRAASSIGYPPSLLNCYGQLFFDIQDRRDEHLFIASIVYPDTRIVEMHDAYIDTEGVGPLLKRAGHNNGLGSVLELAGLNSNARRGIDTSQLPTELESLLMRNAVLLAKNGWINSANSRGIGHAKSLIAAAKMGGNTTQRKTPGTTMGSSIRDEILRIPPANARVRQGASASPSLASPQLVPQDEE